MPKEFKLKQRFKPRPIPATEDEAIAMVEDCEENAIRALEVGDSYTDADGDTWTRVE